MARGDWDRWSDVDLLIVTQAGSGQQWQLFNLLRQHKPILHHHPFILMEPSGGFMPGIAFEDESVFHFLDLNFMALDEFQSPQSLERFGSLRDLYNFNGNRPKKDEHSSYTHVAENPDEKRIGMGLHWVRKAIKKTLRGVDNWEELTATSTRLKEIIEDYPEDVLTPGGNICRLTRHYIEIAHYLLSNTLAVSSSNEFRL